MRSRISACAFVGVALALAPAARAADKATVDAAVDRAVAYLKSAQQTDGTWKHEHIGATALAGLALLEGGVQPTDPALQSAARAVRAQSIGCNYTYSLSLLIMFLDRLGDPADSELIASMALRLLAGQHGDGGWDYECPRLSAGEAQRLETQLRQRPELTAREAPPDPPKGRRTVQDLPREIQDQLRGFNQQGAGAVQTNRTDNSNTQFAVLALWIARRQGMPVEGALRRLDPRFRATQNPDGGWGYMPRSAGGPGATVPPANAAMAAAMGMSGEGSTPAMTCAGLLSLALSHGTALETTLRAGGLPGTVPAPPRRPAIDFSKDPVVRRGIEALGAFLAPPRGGQGPPVGPETDPRIYYLLFSMERVAVIYGLDTFAGKDWYDYGMTILLRSQQGDGSWRGQWSKDNTCGVDTAFGILFLRRANLARDLTAILKGKVGDVTIRGTVGAPPPESRPAAPAADNEVARLGDELVQAPPARQEAVLAKLRDSKGAEYTDALAYAIHKLDGAAKGKARDALADRLTRMSAKTLTAKLQDDDLEVRRAAALAVAMKEDRTNVPRLIELLQDPEPPVAHAARAALKTLSGQDFGPGPEASRADVTRAVAAWKEWWARNGDK